MKSDQTSSIYRYNDQVALSLESVGHQIYLDAAHARWLAGQLIEFFTDIELVKFTKSQLETVRYPADVPSRYKVTVGNIGAVYDGSSLWDANEHYIAYRDLSLSGEGRYGHEQVVMWKDGEPIEITESTLCEQ